MEAKVGTWGRSYAVRIPLIEVKELGLKEGETLDIRIDGGALMMKPKCKSYDLETMLDNMAKQEAPELEWGNIDPLPTEWPSE